MKIKHLFLTLIAPFLLINTPIRVKADDVIPLNGTSGLLLDYASGNVIIAKDINKRLAPASMTKMMGMYLVMESLNNKILIEDQLIRISLKASSMGGSQIYLEENEEMMVKDLFKAVCIASANDAMYALGEAISGSNSGFVNLMNQTAKRLGMKDTNFVNVAGYDDPNHYTTAYDMALLARALIRDYPDILTLTSQLEGYVRDGTFWLVNTNKLVASYPGMDGLKTGFTNSSLYCLTASAKRDNLRLIAVSMGNKTIKERSEDITSLLDYGFANFKSIQVYQKDQIIASTKFKGAKEEKTSLKFLNDVYVTVRKNQTSADLNETYRFSVFYPPIKKDQVVGELIITNLDNWQFKFGFVVIEDVNLSKWYDDFFIRLWQIIF